MRIAHLNRSESYEETRKTKGAKYYDYSCKVELRGLEAEKHFKNGCDVESTPTEFFEEIENEAAINRSIKD
jgi:hypothetical protein